MRQAITLIFGLAAIVVPAGAQISTDNAMGMCMNQVRQDASARFGSSAITFPTMNLTRHEGAADHVSGTFVVQGDQGSGTHTFDCSVDLAGANLRSVRIDSPETANLTGSGNSAISTDSKAMDMCRDAVRTKIFDHGYIETNFKSISIDNTSGRSDMVTGQAMGDTAGHENLFGFSCQVDRYTGAVGSVNLNASH